jgi:FtsH-binding integral membrane protein
LNPEYYQTGVIADAAPEARAEFIKKTYLHLAAAILAFVGIEFLLFQTALPEAMVNLLAGSRWSWMIVLLAFMGISHLADNWASSSTSQNMQYLGLGIYVVAQAIIFVPLLMVASLMAGPELISAAGMITLVLFAAITFTAVTTKKDFSFLGGILKVGSFIALGVIVLSLIFGFNLGLLFSGVMVLFAGASILYSTSNVLHRYGTGQHVAAALSLFAAVALLFWYVLRFLMGSRRD